MVTVSFTLWRCVCWCYLCCLCWCCCRLLCCCRYLQIRDRFYRSLLDTILQAIKKKNHGALVGSFLYAWAGEGRARSGQWSPGDPFTGDHPGLPQGQCSVYDTDLTTLALLSDHAHALRAL